MSERPTVDTSKLVENIRALLVNVLVPVEEVAKMNLVLTNCETVQKFMLITTGLSMSMQDAFKTMTEMVVQGGK